MQSMRIMQKTQTSNFVKNIQQTFIITAGYWQHCWQSVKDMIIMIIYETRPIFPYLPDLCLVASEFLEL